jgi:hypothetical protein
MSDEDFDDALWLSFLSRVSRPADLESLPPGARMYFATRSVEWDLDAGQSSQRSRLRLPRS